jgi:penicillin-binding protein activator
MRTPSQDALQITLQGDERKRPVHQAWQSNNQHRAETRGMRNPTLMACPLAILLVGCVAPEAHRYVAQPSTYVDTTVQGPVSGVGIESQDIEAMADRMARDLLATPAIANRSVAPRIILDDSDFTNRGAQAFDKGMITDSLRVKLNRAAQGRMLFLDNEHMATVNANRELKRSGVTDVGTTGLTKAVAGADFKLVGTIRTLTGRNGNTGTVQRRTQITFEMTDQETGVLVWSNDYAFQKSAADDIVYQ